MIAGQRQDRRRIVAVRIVELIVVVLRFAEIVDHVAKVKKELRQVLRVIIGKVADHLVGDLILILWAAGATGVADRMKHQLFLFGDFGFSRGGVGVEDLGRLNRGSGTPRGGGNGSVVILCSRLSWSIFL